MAPQANYINELSSTVKEVFSFAKKMDARICRRLDDLDIRVERMESELRKLSIEDPGTDYEDAENDPS